MSARSTTLVGTNVEHFEQLSRERDVLLKTSNRQTAIVNTPYARLRNSVPAKDAFQSEVHVANETLGVVHRELTMYKNEQARLQQVIHRNVPKSSNAWMRETGCAGETQRKRDFYRVWRY
jgi:hypothetical protein